MEMDVKADKIALDSKVSMSMFDNTFNMLDEGLREALQKMDEYMNEETALKHALAKLSADLKGKMDGQAFQALRQYLGVHYMKFSNNLCQTGLTVQLFIQAHFCDRFSD